MTEQNLNTEQSNSTNTVLCNGLRIGNYLKYKNTNDLAIVELIHKKHFDCRDEFGLFTPNGNYEPITLNEEWFIKLGFKKLRDGERFELEKFSIDLYSEFFPKGRVYYNSWAIIDKKIDYVHELQNLYFTITQRELTVA